MNHRAIEAFRAVMTTGTMTEASRVLRTSQPAVSRMISDLERSLGLSLFDRRHGRVAPTKEGLRLLEAVERSYRSLDSVLQFAADLRDFRDVQIAVAAMPALCLDLVPLAVSDFLAAYPKARVAVHARSSRQVIDWIIAQQTDIGLATPPYDVRGVACDLAVEVPLLCILHPEHRLAGKREIRADDLDGERIISLSNSLTRHRLQQAFDEAGVRLEPGVETPLSIVAARQVELGTGIALVEPYTAAFCAGRRIVARPFVPEIGFSFGLLRPDHAVEGHAAAVFREILIERLTTTGLPCGASPTVTRSVRQDR
ncbi:LysR substrate-binding domain-containing protein [Lutibaculum baratangense]|uniref:Transcriptional regulator, LysR family n=1 Tax=Lutibaculum baratangense AMV1 TaxID=631454 RepID=V4TNY3_9HYPH|nr:LysR substrate-binding domain-containing protein [Lutibaculum baratangense]ESR27383.1 transcriptional regulator, LysR family [Lutibaculum baratangense AMV1]